MDLTYDEIRDWIEERETTLPLDAFAAAALELASSLSPGRAGRAELLNAAGWAAEGSDRLRALDLHDQAVRDGGWTTLDPRAGVVDDLLHLGRDDEAGLLLAELRARPGEPRSLVGLPPRVGEILEMHERWPEAERWYSIGLRDFDPDLDEPDVDEDLCLSGRYRVRRMRGRGLDAFDRWLEDDAPDAAAAIRERSAPASEPTD